MIRIAICDDSSIDTEMMRAFLEDYYAKKNCFCEITTYKSGEELIETYQRQGNKFHLLFMDIYMKQLNGIETATLIRKYDENVKIVFCTVSSDHAVDSYDVFAYGYLIKPFDVDKMKTLLNKFTKSVMGEEVSHLRVKSEYADRLIALHDIVYIESSDKVLYIHKKDKEVIKTYGKLSSVQEQLNEKYFIRCHQSYIVNFNHVTGIEDSDFKTILNEMVPIRKKDFYKFRESYQRYLISEKKN
ncbi:MAG: LytTR family DNA-binding domain-containing protein [Clostridiales bacterium]|nr:LytTR family DNA-binding domain-containing protein [Clostridiales bacterium]